MTETEVGYNGYMANNPQPDILECNKLDTNNKNSFNLFTKTNIKDDHLAIDLDVMQSQGPGYYHLDKTIVCEFLHHLFTNIPNEKAT